MAEPFSEMLAELVDRVDGAVGAAFVDSYGEAVQCHVASGGDDGRSATDLNDNSSYSGFLFEAGGRVGAEVHFGFLGLPYLAMQASVGLALRYESRTYESAASSGTTGTRFALNSGRNFDLDSIFLHGLGLILYLP
jgi:hypothetical protein